MLEARQIEVRQVEARQIEAPCKWVSPEDNITCMFDGTACSNCNKYEPRI